MRISDWSSDVCSSDLVVRRPAKRDRQAEPPQAGQQQVEPEQVFQRRLRGQPVFPRIVIAQPRLRAAERRAAPDRKSVVSGKSVSVRVDLGGRRIIKKKNKQHKIQNDTSEKLAR